MTQNVYLVATQRTPVGKANRGFFRHERPDNMLGNIIRDTLKKVPNLDTSLIQDGIFGCAMPEGAQGMNIGRIGVLLAGLPNTVPGMTINRFCASSLQAIATASQAVISGQGEAFVAAGVESISGTQGSMNTFMLEDTDLKSQHPGIYWTMLQTAEEVARRFEVSREDQDAYGLRSQMLAAKAADNGVFDQEIVPVSTTMNLFDRATRAVSGQRDITVSRDEGIRPDTLIEGLSGLNAVLDGGTVTAGNASQFSDGSVATLVCSRAKAQELGVEPLGVFRDFVVAGCEPEVMGIGPVYAIPKLLARAGLTVDDIGLWEINEAFAVQVLYCARALGIPLDRLNVNGGAIALGHPYGVSGARIVGSGLLEAKRRGVKYFVASMCIGGGMGAAALFEIE
jgi:acetyl-CoA C-acetyltransferase